MCHRSLEQELSRAHIACDVHVATEYGQMVMPELAGVKVCVGRLDVEEMRALLKKNGQNNYAAVVDATHPFATEVSANIRESTKGSGIPYLRLQRRMDDGICSIPENEGMKERAGTVHVFADYESCVQALTDTSGNILLTTSSFMRSLSGGILLLPEFFSGVSYLDKRFFNLAISSSFLRS